MDSASCKICGTQRHPSEKVCSKCNAIYEIAGDQTNGAPSGALVVSVISLSATVLGFMLLLGNSTLQSSQIEHLQKKVAALEYRLNIDKSVAVLDPTEAGYQAIQFQGAVFYVAIGTTIPYLDGVRTTIKIGNPSMAEFTDVKVNAKWGLASSKEFKVSTLKPGVWTDVDLTLGHIELAKYNRLEISLNTTTVHLNK